VAGNDDLHLEAQCAFDISIGCVFQNEARFLREWLEYHKLIGVQHFILVDDRSTDAFWEVLRPYICSGEVELFSNPCPEPFRGRSWPKYQVAVHGALVRYLQGVSKWLALVDVDEFIVPSNTDTLVGFLRDYEEFGALYIRWEPFGTSYVTKVPDHELMTTALYLKWRFIRGFHMFGKSIVKPHRVLSANIHHCELIPGFSYWDSNPDMQSDTSLVRVFHYWTRDETFLFGCKLPRTLLIKAWEKEEENLDLFRSLFNDVPDYSMRRFEQQLRSRIFGDESQGR